MKPIHRPDLEALRFRAQALRTVREFFFKRDVLEVETPTLSRGVSLDCHIDVLAAEYHPLGYPRPSANAETFYLQTSPEPHMKRLLCRGFPDIYQIAKAFRNGEKGGIHNPEFTMLEWYRRDFSLSDLMEEAVELCLSVAGPVECVRRTYREAFLDALGVDPLSARLEDLLALPSLKDRFPRESVPAFATRTDVLEFLMAHVVEPGFDPGSLTLIRDFPAEQAAQARLHAQDDRLAHRFEVYGGGMELGNGYLELADPEEYDRRFDGENAKRRARGKPELPKDPALLQDLRLGLPPCAGVAMGFDRLVQFALDRGEIASVITFPWDFC